MFSYSSEVLIGLQHHIFVQILLGRIQQIPLFQSEVDMYIIIGHCILKYPIHVYIRKHGTDNIVDVYFFAVQSHNSGVPHSHSTT